ncbi:MAG TPA: hypothetical protein VMB34_15300 [Acetobacteraceae bacterium]|nr:hypothetical protein [Acetobacteraceae bacterium]
MIRPVTCLAFLLACGSGLYLYQAKHRVKLLDDQIAAIVKSTDALREQTRMLSAEWTLLNDPERLRKLSTQFLTLQTVSPNQFTSLADLDSRLPAPLPQGAPPAAAATSAVVAQATPPAADHGAHDTASPATSTVAEARVATAQPTDAAAPAPSASAQSTPHSAIAAPEAAHASAAPSVTSVVAAAASKPPTDTTSRHPDRTATAPHVATVADQARDHAATKPPLRVADVQSHTTDRRRSEPRDVAQRAFVPRNIEARPVMAVRTAPPMPIGGSFLGMAHDMPAPPAPMPMGRAMPVAAPIPYSTAGG